MEPADSRKSWSLSPLPSDGKRPDPERVGLPCREYSCCSSPESSWSCETLVDTQTPKIHPLYRYLRWQWKAVKCEFFFKGSTRWGIHLLQRCRSNPISEELKDLREQCGVSVHKQFISAQWQYALHCFALPRPPCSYGFTNKLALSTSFYLPRAQLNRLRELEVVTKVWPPTFNLTTCADMVFVDENGQTLSVARSQLQMLSLVTEKL